MFRFLTPLRPISSLRRTPMTWIRAEPRNIELPKEINETSKQSSQARTKIPSGLEMSGVLTTGYWPPYPPTDARLPHKCSLYQGKDVMEVYYKTDLTKRLLGKIASLDALKPVISKFQPAELIAKFLDEKLRSGNKSTSEEELGHTLDEALVLFRFIQFFEEIRLEDHAFSPEDVASLDMYLLQLWSRVDENAAGACAQLVFTPIDESFAGDAPLLPSGFQCLFRFIQSKDIYEAVYEKVPSKMLLSGRSKKNSKGKNVVEAFYKKVPAKRILFGRREGMLKMGNLSARHIHAGYGVSGDPDPNYPPPRPVPRCIRCWNDPFKKVSKKYKRKDFDSTEDVKTHYDTTVDDDPCCNCLEHHADFPCENCGNGFSTIEDRKLHYEMCPHRMWDAWNKWKDDRGY